MKSFLCEAVLFDLDGVLVDSTPAIERVWREWAGRHGIEVGRILEVSHGRRTAETIRLVAPRLDADAEARELERIEMESLDGVLEVRGAAEMLSALADGRWTVVTSGTMPLATERMRHVGLPLPEGMVTAEAVVHGKPHPEPYLKGAELLGVRPEACVVVEDAPTGVQAAKAAGMSVLAVATTHGAQDLADADAVAGSLAEIEVTLRRGASDGVLRAELRVADRRQSR